MIMRGANAFFLAGDLFLTACGSDDSDDVVDAGRNLARAPEPLGSLGSTYLLGAPTKAESRPSQLNERVFQTSDNWE